MILTMTNPKKTLKLLLLACFYWIFGLISGCSSSKAEADYFDNYDAADDNDSEIENEDSETNGIGNNVDFPLVWTFDDGPQGFESEFFVHNLENGTFDFEGEFESTTDRPRVFRNFFATNWTGAVSIDFTVKTTRYLSGGFLFSFISGNTWIECDYFVAHSTAEEWVTITLNLDNDCGSFVYTEMVQSIGVAVIPSEDSIMPEQIGVSIDKIVVNGESVR